MANAVIRHYEPEGDGQPPCGAADGWWIKTPRYVTCMECRKHLPKTVHLLFSRERAKCGEKVTAATASDNPSKVSCSRCIPRPTEGKRGAVVHMVWRQDPLAEDKALCNVPYARHFTEDPKEVTCGLCQTRWAPMCKYCRNEKPSREPVCRRPECRQRHRKETMHVKRPLVTNPNPEA